MAFLSLVEPTFNRINRLLTNQVTNSMEQSPSGEANKSFN